MGTLLRAWAGAGVVVALGVGVTQCALMPSLDGFSGSQGVPEASLPDASEAGGDAGRSDAGDGGRWCASLSPAPFFCDDFDDQGPLSRWTGQNVGSGSSVARDGTAFQSAPNALLTLTPASVGPTSSYVYLSTTATKQKVHVAYDMRIDARDPKTGYAEVNYIDFDTPGLKFAIYMRVYDSVTSLSTLTSEVYLPDGGIPAHDVALAGNPRFDGWRRVTVDVDLASTPHTLSATIDGKLAAQQTLESGLYGPGPVTVRPGIGYSGYPTTSEWRVRYDNVTIDWE